MHKGPVTVIATEYGTRLDNQPVSRSATVDGVPDFVNLYEYDYQWSGAYNGDGTTSTSETSSNNASGSGAGSGTHDWSWSYEGSCGSGSGSGSSSGGGSGCGSNSGSSGTSSSNWSDSYDETVSYPGFYSGAYYSSYGYGSGGGYAGDEPLDYIGDDFSSSSSGYGGESGSGNGDGNQGDEGQPPFLEWELRGPFLEEWDELRDHLARERSTREQMRQSAEQLWQELDQINRGKHGVTQTVPECESERRESELAEMRERIGRIEQRLADIQARRMTSFIDLKQRTGGYVITVRKTL